MQSGWLCASLGCRSEDEDEAGETIAAGADIVMLDNIEGSELASVAAACASRVREGNKFLLETSGGTTESNLRERATAGK